MFTSKNKMTRRSGQLPKQNLQEEIPGAASLSLSDPKKHHKIVKIPLSIFIYLCFLY
tara:strand:- start:21 stop:191 length:171 start_codon:yes stop_codon:yes gene_type:complete